MLFTGDCVAGIGQVMPGVFNVDGEQAASSFRRLADLSPSIACFGHGDPLTRDTARILDAATAAPQPR